MALDYEALGTRLRGGSAVVSDDVVAAVESTLADDEAVADLLTSTNGIERLDGAESLETTEEGGSALVATDRKLCFGVDTPAGPEVGPIPFSEIKSFDWSDGLLRRAVDVSVWGEGTYRFRPAERGDVETVGRYAERMSDVWDAVAARLGDARQHVAELGDRLEAGDRERAAEHRQEARRLLSAARDRVEADAPAPRAGLTAAVSAVERDLVDAATDARIARARRLRERGDTHAHRGQYGEAHADFRTAVRRLERAFDLAAAHDPGRLDEIRADLSALKERIEAVEARPLAAAQSAHERARGADPTRAVVCYADALEAYRTALTAGWGVDRADFDGDRDDLRDRIQTVVGDLVDARLTLADELIAEADQLSFEADDVAARDRYEAAAQQLSAGLRLAGEFAAGDEDALRDRLDDVRQRTADLAGRTAAA
jgi:tetratricopeptide (TPR) repeat protein